MNGGNMVNKNYISAFVFAFIVFFIFFFGFFIGKFGFEEVVEVVVFEGEGKVSSNLAAVDATNNGVLAKLETEVRDGSGLVLVNINNILADVNAQYSARVATQVAREYANVSLEKKDVVFNVLTNASVIGGQSAGGAMALSVLSLILDKEINGSVIITGSITEDGGIGNASGIYEKAKAAKENGMDLILVPEGVGEVVSNYKKIRKCGSYVGSYLCETDFEEVFVNVGEDIGIEVIEVYDIEEAVSYYFV